MVVAAAITPAGVRDGELATLRALSIRRGAAVLGYCEQVCPPGHALDAAADAFARFRAAVVATPHLNRIDPEAMLLSAARHAAADRAPAPVPTGRLGLRAAGSRCCPLMPELLAARADEQLSAGDVQRVERHLRRCRRCQEAEERWRSAELAYRAAAPDAPAELAVETIERALRSVAPTIAPFTPSAAGGRATAAPWPEPPLEVAEPPELPATLARAAQTGERAPQQAATVRPAQDGAGGLTPADHEPTGGVAMAWPPAAEQSDLAPRWSDAPRPWGGAAPPCSDEPPPPHDLESATGAGYGHDYGEHDDDDYDDHGLGVAAPHALDHDLDAAAPHALDHDLDAAPHALDHDPDATMAWALDAPDFDGEIMAADLRHGETASADAAEHGPSTGPALGTAAQAQLAPEAPGVDAGVERDARRWRPNTRRLLPLAIVAVIVVVALSLVGSLANSDHHRALAPPVAPTVSPAGVGGSAIVAPAKHPRGLARGHAPNRSGTSAAIAPVSRAGQRPPASAGAGLAPARVTPVPSRSHAGGPSTPSSTRPKSPRPAPVANTPASRTLPAPSAGTGTTPSAPAGTAPPATTGAGPPSAPTSSGGTQAPPP